MHESVRLYAICKSMRWAHLPVDGGLYDQHPKLLDDFYLIAQAEVAQQKREADERAHKQNNRKPGGLGSGRRRGRR